MASRRNRGLDRDTFDDGENSIVEMDSATFGRLRTIDSARQTAEAISIYDITPDPKQPRRVMPSKIRKLWNGDTKTLGALFQFWQGQASDERGSEFSIGAFFEDTDEAAARLENDGPIARALVAVCSLAASIKRDGLTNPITVARHGTGYVIETGERRWLTYHLLAAREGENWQKIPARVVPQSDVLRQASENTAREDLNAIGKARQFALILMHLYEKEGTQFQPFDEMENDRAFYAQVADGNVWRIPRGRGELVANALGVKGDSQLREIRGFLSVDDDLWIAADDNNWTHGKLRNHILEAKKPMPTPPSKPAIPSEFRRYEDETPQPTSAKNAPVRNGNHERFIEERLEKLAAAIHDESAKDYPDTARLEKLRAEKALLETNGSYREAYGEGSGWEEANKPLPGGRWDDPPFVSLDEAADPYEDALSQIRKMAGAVETLTELLNEHGDDLSDSQAVELKRRFGAVVNECGTLLGQMRKAWGV